MSFYKKNNLDIESFPGNIGIFNKRGEFIDANSSLVKLTGFKSKKNLLEFAKDPKVLLPKEEYLRLIKGIKNTFQTGFDKNEYNLIRKDGTKINIYISAKLIKDYEDNPVSIVNIEDITKQKKAEKELKKSNDKFESLFNNITSGIIAADPKTKKFLFANQTALNLLGYSEKELLNLGVTDIHPKKDLPYVLEQFGKQFKGEIKVAQNLPVLRKDRTVFYCDITSTPQHVDGKDILLGVFNDVTERKKAENNYKDILDNSLELVQSVDANGKFIFVNNEWKSVMGYSDDELKNLKFQDILRKDMFPHCFKLFNELKKGGSFKNLNTVFVAKNGKEIIVNGNINAHFENGEFIATRGIFRDITKEKKAEESLKDSEKKFKTLFESSKDAIMTLNSPDWKFNSGNPATIKLFNCKDEKQFISLGPWQVSPKKQPDGTLSSDKAKEMIIKAMKKGSNLFEWIHMTIDGKEFPATVLLTKVELEKGKPFLQATVRDITEQKKSEEQLNLFKKFADASNQGMGWASLDGKIKYVNAELARIFGEKDSKSSLGKNVALTYYPKSEGERLAKEIFPIVMEKGYWSGELIMKKKDGSLIPTQNSLFIINDEKGKPKFLANILSNITEQKKIQEKLKKKADELERFNKFAVDRELKMIELKKEIIRLKDKLGEK